MTATGELIVISGPSGTGKGTIATILAECPNFTLSISRTTRPPRPEEIDGVHYQFTDRADFERLISVGAFFEFADYNGHFYGTPIENVHKQLAAGKNVILEIDVNGAAKIRTSYLGDYISIFILPPSRAEMERRLLERGQNTDEDIQKRIKIARFEINDAPNYDYLVINDDVNRAVSDIKAIVLARSLHVSKNIAYIQHFKEEF